MLPQKIKPGVVLFVRHGDHKVKTRRAIVLERVDDRAVVAILPTGTEHAYEENVLAIEWNSRGGRSIGATLDSWLYPWNVKLIDEGQIVEVKNWHCHPGLFRAIRTQFRAEIERVGQEDSTS